MSIALFLFGGITVKVERAHATDLLNLCLSHGYPYTDVCCEEDGALRMRFPASAARRLIADCEARGIPCITVAQTGLPFLFFRLRKRPGLLLGAVLALLLLVLSERFVWEIRIVGNETLGHEEICEILEENGLYVGSYLSDLDIPRLENRILIGTDRLSWISIHLDGTVARVQVIEAIGYERDEKKSPANLIATRDGQIEYLELFRGESVVSVGQAVKKGELLVSGIMESERVGCRFTRASGSVMARTERVLSVEVPLRYREKVYKDEKTLCRTVHFFDFSMKIFKSTGNIDSACDIIEKESVPDFLEGHTLPLSVTSQIARCYTEEWRERTPTEASHAAFSALEEELAQLSGSVQVLSKRIVERIDGTGVRLECTLVCVEDIAVQQEFEIVE